MKHSIQSISPSDLYQVLSGASPCTLLDVRRAQARQSSAMQLPTANWYDPAAWLDWKDSISSAHPVVVYCAKGHEISQGVTAMLQALGLNVQFLEGGLQAWQQAGLPTEALI